MPRGGKREGAGRKRIAPKRPSYKPEYARDFKKLYELGATDVEVADFFEIEVRTLYYWMRKYPDLIQAAKAGKDALDDRVERSLYHRAVGYTHDAVKIFQFQGQPVIVPYKEHVPPDVSAATLWLKNRRKDVWRDKIDHEHAGKDGAPLIPIVNVTVGSS